MPCIHGHPLVDGGDVCADGHAAGEDVPGPASIADLQNILHQMINIQNTSLQQPTTTSRSDRSGKAKPERPTIKQSSSDGDWELYQDSWRRYKQMCKLTDATEIRNELRCTCAHEVNQLLFDIIGPATLDTCTETELLGYIKSVAVEGSHKEVHRQRFQALKQEEGQRITSFLAKLKSQAQLCDFNVTCPNQQCLRSVSYSTNMVAGQLISGLHNTDHQAKVLAEAATLTTLSQKFDRLVSLETTDLATKRLNMTVSPGIGTSSSSATSSSYPRRQQRRQNNNQFRQQRQPPPPPSAPPTPCKGCGETSHPNNKSLRRADCPAFNVICSNCKIKGHFRRVCRKPTNPSSTRSLEEDDNATEGFDNIPQEESVLSTSYIFMNTSTDSDSSDQATGGQTAHAVPHMEWNGSMFVRQAPMKPPRMTIAIRVITDNSIIPVTLMLPPGFCAKSVTTTTLADSGAQTCSGDVALLNQLGCGIENLLPTTHGIRGVTSTRLELLGVLPVRISAKGRHTNQIMYFAQNTRGCLLSEKALRDLHVLPNNFPSICHTATSIGSSVTANSKKASCGCLKRLPPPQLPEKIPFPPVPENVEKLEQYIRSFFAASGLNTCPHQPLPAMTGDLMTVTLRPNAVPYAIHTPIPVPLHWEEPVRKDIMKDVALEIIEKVASTTPNIWCAKMVVVPKKDGSPRRTVDFQKLNAASIRHTHHTPSPFQQVIKVPAGMYKSILDAWNGYHSVLLAESARDLFTFLCNEGRFRYKRCPQGFHGSGDIYTHHYDEITKDFKDKIRQIDDSCLWKPTILELFWHTMKYMHHCTTNGVIFNPKKLVFCKKVVDFAGFLITADGIKPSLRIVDAIRKFPTPKNISGIRSWFGLVNQVSFAFAQTELMAPFRDLLKHNRKFFWDDTLEQLFQQTKVKIVHQIEEGIKAFDCSKATCLCTDWSKNGIGFFLFQQSCRCEAIEGPHCGGGHWQIVFAGSRFTTEAESRYAPIEGEALAVVYSLESSRMFVTGCPRLIVAVDHKPLLKILSDQQPLDQIKNPRLQRFKERAMRYQFTIKHTPGTKNSSADAASRYPVGSPSKSSMTNSTQHDFENQKSSIVSSLSHVMETAPDEETDVELSVTQQTMVLIMNSPQMKAVTWERIRDAAIQDRVCSDLAKVISSGFPNHKRDLPEHLRPFWALRDDLYTIHGVPVSNRRILIPSSLRREVLECLHSAHQGVTGMQEHAKHRFFWPGLDAALRLTRAQCSDCNGRSPSQPEEPLLDGITPEFPFQSTATDLFHHQGHKFLLYVDRFTAWLEIALSPRSDALSVINILRRWFTTFGVPAELASDGGPPFDSTAYIRFLKDWGISRRLSSAYFPRSNGRAELGVKSGKRLLMSNLDTTGSLDKDAVSRALMTYRNTPLQDCSLSPAELLYGHKLRDLLPSLPSHQTQVLPKWKDIRSARETILGSKMAERAEKSSSTHSSLYPLRAGQHVLIQNGAGRTPKRWDRSGLVVEVLPFRQYRIKYDGSGRLHVRNRQHLRPFVPPVNSIPPYPAAPSLLVPSQPPASPSAPPSLVSRKLPAPAHESTPIRSDLVTSRDLGPPPSWRSGTVVDDSGTQPQLATGTSTSPNDSRADDTLVPRTTQTQDLSNTIPYDISTELPPSVRRSTRPRHPPSRLSPKFVGKSHADPT